ncbi:hypothetical protein MW388_003207 [Acinetobacter baumannii]|nr:hypothetical protein [Acinetobacter baumannii]
MTVFALFFNNLMIFIGFSFLLLGLFGTNNKKIKFFFGGFWLLVNYIALAKIGIAVGIPFTSINFF